MSIDTRSLIEKLNDHLADPKNVADAKAYFARFENRDKMEANQVKRFWKKYNTCFDELVNKVITKYESKEYKDNWYGRGIFPPEPLYFFLYDVAKKYGKEFTLKQYRAMENTMFTDAVYVLNDWCFEHISGQGCAVKIYKYGK